MKVFTGEAADKEALAFEECGKCTTEATMNIRTVAALTREDFFVARYEERLQTPLRRALKKAWSFGILYGFTTAIFFPILHTIPLKTSTVKPRNSPLSPSTQ